MESSNGGSEGRQGPLELSETLRIEMEDGTSLPFEVVGILEDSDNGVSYAVLRRDASEREDDEFIVTDLDGNLVQDDGLAQDVLDDFLAYAQDGDDRGAHNGEAH
jgi:hypothetical protein